MASTQIHGLVEKCNATLRGAERSGPSRREYFNALTLADRALELATSATADQGLVRQCEILQEYCRNELTKACGKIVDERERSAYVRRAVADPSSASSPSSSTSDTAGEGAEDPSRGGRSVSFAEC